MLQVREYPTTHTWRIYGEPISLHSSAIIRLTDSSWIKVFDDWLVEQNHLQVGETVFGPSASEEVPEWIAMWILDE
jgi:hypothetical protein